VVIPPPVFTCHVVHAKLSRNWLEICPLFSSYAQLNIWIFRPVSVEPALTAKRVEYWASWNDLTVKVYYNICTWSQMIETGGGNRPGSVIDMC
jgi:hypothetical protein